MITLLRVLFGFIVACLVAGLVTVAFVVTPADIASLPAEAQPERLGNAGILALLAATHSAIFAFPFAIIAIGMAELTHLRSWVYYVLVGVAIALGGFAAEYAAEVPGSRRSSMATRWPHTLPSASPAASPTGCRRAPRRRPPRRCPAAGGPAAAADPEPDPSRSPRQPDPAHVRSGALTRNCVVAAQQSV